MKTLSTPLLSGSVALVMVVLAACASASAADLAAKGDRLAAEQRWQEAIVQYDKAITKDANLVAAYVGRGKTRLALEDFEGAIGDFETALRADTALMSASAQQYALAHEGRARTRVAAEDFAGAIADLEEARTIAPERAGALSTALADVYNRRGETALSSRNFAGALRDFDAALSFAPDSAAYHGNRGQALTGMNDLDGAIAEFDTALTLDTAIIDKVRDPLVNALQTRGRRMQQEGSRIWFAGNRLEGRRLLQIALVDIQRAIDLDPVKATLFADRATIYYWLEQFRLSADDRVHAIELGMRDATSYHQAGTALFLVNECQTALTYFDRAIELNARFSLAFQYRGRCLAILGNTTAALADFRHALTIATTDTERTQLNDLIARYGGR